MTTNTLNEQQDQNNVQKAASAELKEKFCNDYVSTKKDDEFMNLYDALINNEWILTDRIAADLERFKAAPWRWWYSNLNIKDISYYNLLRSVLEQWGAAIPVLRDTAFKTLDDFYDFSDKDRVEQEIKRMKKSDIVNMLNSEIVQRSFLKRALWNNAVIAKKDIAKVLSNIPNLNFASLTQVQKSSLINYLENWDHTPGLLSIIKQFPLQQKIALLERFVPVMSLRELIDYWLVTIYEADDYIKNESYRILQSANKQIDDSKKQQFEENLKMLVDKNTILLPISQYLNRPIPNINQIIDKIIDDNKLINIEKDNSEAIAKAELENAINWKSDFITKIKSDYRAFKGIKNFWDETFFFWTRKNSETWDNEVVTLEIVEITDNGVKIKERTAANWILKDWFIETQTITHPNLHNIFSNFSHYWSWEIKSKIDVKKDLERWKVLESVDLKHINSTEELNQAINEVDDKWKKFKIEKWMVFEFWDSDDAQLWIWKIWNIDPINKTLEVISDNTTVPMDFQVFYESFKHEKWKRVANITNFDSVVSNLQQHPNTEKKFKELVFKKWRFVPKNQETNDNHKWIHYFVWKDNKALKIVSINANSVDVLLGEWEEKDVDKKTKRSLNKAKKASMPLEVFFWYISKHKLEPFVNNDEIEPQVNTNTNAPEKSWSWSKFFFWMQNYLTIIWWIKSFIKSIEDSLKENSELQSAEFALKLWKLLPDSMKQSLVNKQEWIQKKKMWEKVDMLSWMNLDLALKYVEKILKTKNAYEHENEACIIFLLKKHWCLYPKNLLKYKWSYAWYEKLGWKVWDKMFTEYHKECIISNEPPTEEWLITKLLIQQSIMDTSYYPKRRTTIVWDFAQAYWSWRSDGITAWENEAKTLTTFAWRKNLAVWKFKEWRHMFAIWAMMKMYEKWGWAEDRNLLPFIIMITWMSKWWHQETCGKIKWLAFTHQIPALFCVWNPESTDTYEKAVIAFAKEIWTDCYDELGKIIKMRNTDEAKMIEKMLEFWKKWWSKLTPKLTTTDFSVFLESSNNADIKAYNWIGWVIAWKNQFSEDNYDNWVYDVWNWLMPLTWWKTYITNLIHKSSSNHNSEYMEKVSKNFLEYIEWIRKYSHPDGDEKTKEGQKKIFLELNKHIASAYANNYNKSTKYKDIYKELANKWFWLPTDDNYDYTISDVESGKLDKAFERAFNNFMNKEPTIPVRSLNQVKWDTVLKISEIMKTPFDPYNNSETKSLKTTRAELNDLINSAKKIATNKQSIELKRAIKKAQIAALWKNKDHMEEAKTKLWEILDESWEIDDYIFDMAA